MSQGVVKDLPDPLDTPVSGPTPPVGNPDDLLSQLADEAIDKLIADSEHGVSSPSPSAERGKPVPPRESEPTNSQSNVQSALDAVFDQLDVNEAAAAQSTAAESEMTESAAAPVASPEPAGVEPEPVEEEVPAERATDVGTSAVVDAPVGEPAVDEPAAAPAPVEQPADQPAHTAADEGLVVADLLDDPDAIDAAASSGFVAEPAAEEPEPTPEEQTPQPTPGAPAPVAAAPKEAATAVPVTAAPSEPAAPAASPEQGGRGADVKALLDEAVASAPSDQPSAVVAMLLLPLRVLNAPFAGLSDRTRDALGQIGIVTLLNAIAVLAYVLMFRRGQ